MKVFFATQADTPLSSTYLNEFLEPLKRAFERIPNWSETPRLQEADAIIFHEAYSFKEWRYIEHLSKDPILSHLANKVFVVNADDCATGLLRGLYTSLHQNRFDPTRHRLVPFVIYKNDLVLRSAGGRSETPPLLGSWRGNPHSNRVRSRLIHQLGSDKRFQLETTTSWETHQRDEKQRYLDLFYNSMFSLCPAGWAPATLRIYESMAVGRAPVIIADQFVAPVGPKWSSFSIRVPERRIADLPQILEENAPRALEMGELAKSEWQKFFAPEVVYTYCAGQMVDLFQKASHSTQRQEEKIWRSYQTYYKNGWTLPQRIVNKLRRLLGK